MRKIIIFFIMILILSISVYAVDSAQRCKNIYIENFNSTREGEIIDTNITGLTFSSLNELQLIDTGCSANNFTDRIIYHKIISNTSDSVRIIFYISGTHIRGTNKTYSLWYDDLTPYSYKGIDHLIAYDTFEKNNLSDGDLLGNSWTFSSITEGNGYIRFGSGGDKAYIGNFQQRGNTSMSYQAYVGITDNCDLYNCVYNNSNAGDFCIIGNGNPERWESPIGFISVQPTNFYRKYQPHLIHVKWDSSPPKTDYYIKWGNGTLEGSNINDNTITKVGMSRFQFYKGASTCSDARINIFSGWLNLTEPVFHYEQQSKIYLDNEINISAIIPEPPFIASQPENLTFKGTGQLPDPYRIENCNQLWSLNINISAYFILDHDIDCKGLNWNISNSDSINGILDGRGYSIKNIMIDGNNTYSALSMFEGIGNNSIIKNLWIENVTMRRALSSSGGYGILIDGQANALYTIDNIHFKDINVFAKNNIQHSYYGSVIGLTADCYEIKNISVKNLYVEGTDHIGGIVGEMNNCEISQSFTENMKVSYNDLSFLNYVGGILGRTGTTGSILNNTYVKNFSANFNTGTALQNIGGLIGFENQGQIINSYVFNNSINCSINSTNNYVNCGALAGLCGSVTNSYADVESINPFNQIGTNCPSSAKQNISDLKQQSTFTGFDFSNIWNINEGISSPIFQWNYTDSANFLSKTNIPITITNPKLYNPDLFLNLLSDLQNYEYKFGQWLIEVNITDDDPINNYDVNLSDSGGLFLTNSTGFYQNTTINSLNFDNENSINFSAMVKNLYGDIAYFSIRFNITDSVPPNCVIPPNDTINESLGISYLLNLTCKDEDINNQKITCSSYTNNTALTRQKDYNLTTKFNINQNNSCFINISDFFGNSGTGSFFIEFIPQINQTVPSNNVTQGNVTVTVNVEGISDNTVIDIFLILLWVIFLILTLTIKGVNHKPIGLLNILQMLTGFVSGSAWIDNYFIIGFGIIFVSIGFFVGLIIYERV